MESSLVSISKRCEFYSDKSIVGFVEEPKAFSFKFHDYSAIVHEEENKKKKTVSFSDENTSSMVLEKSESEGLIKEHVKEEMLVYEFMSCGVLNELLDHENFVGGEDDDDDDGFIELNPSLLISNFAYGEEDKEEELNMGFDEQEEVNDFNEWSDSEISKDKELAGYWAKLPMLRRLMLSHPEIEWIWWMDSDALFTDTA